jgi:16S rRNA (uracil1498-N3)-methyltransferase
LAAPGFNLRRRFFVTKFNGETATLEGPAAHHLARVLRAEPGQLYELSDGDVLCLARVERVGREQVDFHVIEGLPATLSKVDATLLIAVVKFERFEWAIEKATELGAGSIVPLAAGRSEKALLAAAPKRMARWEKIVFEAAQQARCMRAPRILPLAKPSEAFLSAKSRSDIRILLSERAGVRPLRTLLESHPAGNAGGDGGPLNITLAIGPEGGWTDEDIAAADAAGFLAVSMGGNILRTETAVVAGLAAVHLCLDSVPPGKISTPAGRWPEAAGHDIKKRQ